MIWLIIYLIGTGLLALSYYLGKEGWQEVVSDSIEKHWGHRPPNPEKAARRACFLLAIVWPFLILMMLLRLVMLPIIILLGKIRRI